MTKVKYKKLGREKALGTVDDVTEVIHIDSRLRGRVKMGAEIHEMLHLLFPDLSEGVITSMERKLTNYLWDLNYRQVDNKKR